MLPVLFNFLRIYAPYITLPVAAVIGFVGYQLESRLSDRYTPVEPGSIEERREERLLKEDLGKDLTNVDSLKDKKFVPKTVFERNVSPSLMEPNK
ncbi:small integral membrane protein 12-A [Ischnura elegans]|uniref:small integral membrane protein 12-A n=1 Tax=Ischnura elegans TaxID=197161 RepID=UPI001ED8BCCF|nr:small integral membrane protein 12-A [Ischnura elegans]